VANRHVGRSRAEGLLSRLCFRWETCVRHWRKSDLTTFVADGKSDAASAPIERISHPISGGRLAALRRDSGGSGHTIARSKGPWIGEDVKKSRGWLPSAPHLERSMYLFTEGKGTINRL